MAILLVMAFGVVTWFHYSSPDPESVAVPDWIEQDFIAKDGHSRTGFELRKVKDIVVHYVANPGSTAAANRSYFNSPNSNTSAHFIVGLQGEIIQCVPMGEQSSASNQRNPDTISIEVCHPDESGEFSAETYQTVVRLTADLLKDYGLNADDVIRHYDVSGKNCPKYYVEHEDAWQKLREDIRDELKKKG